MAGLVNPMGIKSKTILADIIGRAVSWAEVRGVSSEDIVTVLIEELEKCECDLTEFLDADAIAEAVREQMAESMSI